MQELSVLLTLAAVFAIALVSPGPDVALVVRTSLHQGRRAGLASALGLACGILLHTTLVLTGVSLLLSRTPVLFAILQALGALYLAWLGVGALRAWVLTLSYSFLTKPNDFFNTPWKYVSDIYSL
ncbi:LysE family translocator, partial [Pseudomonas aeruginosa]|uniref:LysE family translocator n=1 Tax=Pseudomonas aeruginosa TaxID=287 RepID=UPI0030143184